MDRRAWIKERRRINEERMDTIFAPIYDERWGGYINATHERMVERFLEALPQGARVLDAACGTGKYWRLFLDAGCTVVGTDQSAGMLSRAHAKFPNVPIEKLGLQELGFEAAFDGVACIDAMENVFPEDWQRVLQNFHRCLKPGGVLYLTVELPEDDLASVFQPALEEGPPVVEGEYVHDGAYHYYPDVEQVRSWIAAAGFDGVTEERGDGYRHFIVRQR